MANTRVRPLCSIPGCDRSHVGHGYCSRHYQRFLRYGDPLAGKASPVPAAQQEAFLRGLVESPSTDECVTWPFSRTNKGYGVTTLDDVRIAAHRACCKLAHGEPPSPEHHAAHSCGKGHLGCVNPSHLRWATPTENAHDQVEHGTAPIGSRNPAATLTEAEVLAIYALKGKQTIRQIADSFALPKPTVGDILRGANWASVTGAFYRPGRRSGEGHHEAKLDTAKVRDIRRRSSLGEAAREIAADYGVTPQCVHAVATRKTWARVA